MRLYYKTGTALLLLSLLLLAFSTVVYNPPVGFQQPAGFPPPVYDFSANRPTEAGFELGKHLFYDPILSANNSISCGSCHQQSAAFADSSKTLSTGVEGRLGVRNSPPLMNMAWNKHFFWDGSVMNLDLQPIVPITNHVEMDETLPNIIRKLRNDPYYPQAFNKVFGTDNITVTHIMKALSQFITQCVSSNARYDQVSRKEKGVGFTAIEQQGYALFKQKCNHCHQEPLFTDYTFRNNGIGPGTGNDNGRYTITMKPEDKYLFKVPSLRNLAYTAPYMHDGRFATLEAALDHYTGNLSTTPGTDSLFKKNNGAYITAEEKNKLLAFLHTLNDESFIKNSRLAARIE
ncbi:MAG: cytochrome-c peroxidase [Niastella sp.]|nr:cytochrome-c peroxidase [Niastella sp.]